jgi:type IV pilus assembly protein PilA
MNRSRGFTLMEIMIVLAIISILAAIAIPSFSTYRQRGFNASALSHMHTIRVQEEAYFSDNTGYLTVAGGQGPGPTGALPYAMAPDEIGFRVNVLALGVSYAAFTGHLKGSRLYGTDSAGKVQWRDAVVDPSTDAQNEASNPMLPVGWGTPQ